MDYYFIANTLDNTQGVEFNSEKTTTKIKFQLMNAF